MKRSIRNIALVAAASAVLAAACGCVDTTTEVKVKRDGSGVIVRTSYAVAKDKTGLDDMFSGIGLGSVVAQASMLEADRYRAKAQTIGDGVSFVSAEPVRRGDGKVGVKVVYAFRDIRTVKLDPTPDLEGVPGADTMVSFLRADSGASPITFGFIAGEKAVLTVGLSSRDLPPPAPDEEEGDEDGDDAPADDEAQGVSPGDDVADVRELLEGLRVRLVVETAGKVTKTNASHVKVDSRGRGRSVVTLFDMNIDQTIRDEAALKMLASQAELEDVGRAVRRLEGIPGVTVEPAEKVEIEF